MGIGSMLDADQDEGRRERDGAEGIYGQTARRALAALGGHHGDAGGEVPHDATELAGIDHLDAWKRVE